LFAVFRAKFAEGYNLKDGFSRGIVLIGVPNIPINTIKLNVINNIIQYTNFFKMKNQFIANKTKIEFANTLN